MNAIDFITAVNTSLHMEEAMERTGMSKTAISARCSNYRKKGLKIHNFSESRRIDPNRLREAAGGCGETKFCIEDDEDECEEATTEHQTLV